MFRCCIGLTTLCLLLLTGCSQVYYLPGVERGAGIPVVGGKNAQFLAVNGKELSGINELRLTPGEHQVNVRYLFPHSDMPHFFFKKDSSLTVTVEDGGAYSVEAYRSGTGRHYVWVEDQEQKKAGGLRPPPIGTNTARVAPAGIVASYDYYSEGRQK